MENAVGKEGASVKPRKGWKLALIAIAAVVVMVPLAIGFGIHWLTEHSLRGATKVVLATDGRLGAPSGTVAVTLTNPDDVHKLTQVVRLRRKRFPCGCDHFETVTFSTSRGDRRVSICDHCFDVEGSKWRGGGEYQMPPGFYDKFKSFLPAPAPAKQ